MRLIPTQYVKPYVKTNKSDYIDADAIAEAVGRPTMRSVPVKSDYELELNPECIGNYWIVVVDSPPHRYNARSSPRWARNHSLPDSWLAGAEFPTCRLPSLLRRALRINVPPLAKILSRARTRNWRRAIRGVPNTCVAKRLRS